MCDKIPTVIITTEGGLIQSVHSDLHVNVIEIAYDKDDISVKEKEEPSRISTIMTEECLLYDWTDKEAIDSHWLVAIQEELIRQKELHEYMRDK